MHVSKKSLASDPLSNHDTIVYIPDLPPNKDDDTQLERNVRIRLEKVTSVKPREIKCYSRLGVGVVRVDTDQTRNRLINEIETIVLDPGESKVIISFVAQLELVSYVAIEGPKDKNDVVSPASHDISRRWAALYRSERPCVCEQLSVPFNNIYKVVSTSLEELLEVAKNPDFEIRGRIARIYANADCSFLEGLPRSATEDQLRQAIGKAIQQANISSSSIYIHLDKQSSSACILAANAARIWSTKSHLLIDGISISRKNNLSYRLCIYSIPHSLSIQKILKSEALAGKIINHKQYGENLVIELSDKAVFDQILIRGVIRIDPNNCLRIGIYTASSSPETSEIDEDTWYRTEMGRYKPDIVQFISDPDQAIFQYKWNSKIWVKQFKATTGGGHDEKHARDRRHSLTDVTRHQLRVTVMLNTLAVVRKRMYMIGDRMVHLPIDKRLTTIIYDHRSKLERAGTLPITKTPYQVTRVEVFKEDCLDVYEGLMKSGYKPLLLNMANATSPGGGYRKGDGAQEENLFRRSDYFRSLDIGLDQWLPQRCERFHRASNCQLDPVTDYSTMYPMHEFGAIYTSDLTVFRHSEEMGYMFMEEPLQGVCSLAMAAYRDPQLDGNMLASKHAMGTRKKIENTFSIAFHHKHDSLVLSAFGCGAFRNPPEHVAKIFRSVIEQYAGFFKRIAFAIVDDHNSGQHLNPNGNYKPFKDILDGLDITPMLTMNLPHIIVGSYQLLADGTSVADVCILDKALCKYGALCNDIHDRKHAQGFAHPSLCPNMATKGKCTFTKDTVHMSSFIHQNLCKYGGECRNIDDKQHVKEYEHPSYCSEAGRCDDMSAEHLKQYRHLPLCSEGRKCLEYRQHTLSHCKKFRHCVFNCPHGNNCADFHDQQHRDKFEHPFPTPCSFTPFHCVLHVELTSHKDRSQLTKDIRQHCLDAAHVCPFGRDCKDQSKLHLETAIHIARYLCPEGDKCPKRISEDHLNSFTHPGIPDIRPLCPHADECYDRRNLDHIIRCRHAAKFEQRGILSYFSVNQRIDFVKNQQDIIERVTAYIQHEKWKPLPSGSVPLQILNWIRTVQPVHRCNPYIFESILLHGHVMSRQYMENLKDAQFVANSVLQHSRIRRIPGIQEKMVTEQATKFILGLVQDYFVKHGFGTALTTKDTTLSMNAITKAEACLASNLKVRDLDAIRTKAMEIADASIHLHTNPSGIGFGKDKDLGTDQTVFSIIGPHLGHYYGDVFIVFKREILHHPDANFTVQAATSYTTNSAYDLRPWLGKPPSTHDDRVQLYHRSKLNASVPGYDYAAALELMAMTSFHFTQKTMDITLDKILERWFAVDSHLTIEGHLPPLIPLSYIDHIYIPQNLFDSLTNDSRKAINANFKNRITCVPHDGEADQPVGPHGPKPPSKSREEYQDTVVEKLRQRFLERVKNSSLISVRGVAITLAPSDFTDPYVLPLTISQAYKQYCSSRKHPPPENAYFIYWQLAAGDIILTLSDGVIKSDTKKTNPSCLSCYIAGKGPPSDTSYHEHYSYMNDSLPFRHPILRETNKFAGKSNRFLVGCNTDNFMTFCLEIQRSTNTVTLSHVGPNAIYNHEKISCLFKKSQLDLEKLDYIYLTSGSRTVPVRNLTICFEKQIDLHPTYDQHFKKGSPSVVADRKDEKKSPGSLERAKSCFFRDDNPTLSPCRDNVNCLRQHSERHGPSHNAQYSHPCPFSELCRKREPHFAHEPHRVSMCKKDKKCDQLTDPFHRAEYRHTDLPDFLLPCRYQAACYEHSAEHRVTYSHGEQVYKTNTLSATTDRASPLARTPCKWGSKCRDIGNNQHRREYSHPTTDQPKSNDLGEDTSRRRPCAYGAGCFDLGSQHRVQFSHPTPKALSDSDDDT